jgi:HEAT repeat protein
VDDEKGVDGVVLRVALVVLAIASCAWLVLSLVVLLGRVRHDRGLGVVAASAMSERQAQRLVRCVRSQPRTEWGKWRRVTALQRLEEAHRAEVPQLVPLVLGDPDERIATAALGTLGDIGDAWAIDLLVHAMLGGDGPRSRIAAELERLAPAPGERLLPLLRDWDSSVRFWGATLLSPYPDLGEAMLIELTWDQDPNVRAAAVETLGVRSGTAVGAALLARLEDSEWFVRVHAARAAGRVLGAEAAPRIVRLLADERWWVRTAAKDALRGIGIDAVPSILSVLGHEDAFARNGAAEVLQDIGFVDFLALDDPASPLLRRIYEAGGERLRDATETRVDVVPTRKVRAA